MHYERKDKIAAVSIAELILGVALAVLGGAFLLRYQTEPEHSLATAWLPPILLILGILQFLLGCIGLLTITYDLRCCFVVVASGTLLVVLYQATMAATLIRQGSQHMQSIRHTFSPSNCTRQPSEPKRKFVPCTDDLVAMEETVNRMIAVFVAGLAVIQACTLLCALRWSSCCKKDSNKRSQTTPKTIHDDASHFQEIPSPPFL